MLYLGGVMSENKGRDGMQELEKHIRTMLEAGVTKIIISHPAAKSEVYKKITVEKRERAIRSPNIRRLRCFMRISLRPIRQSG